MRAALSFFLSCLVLTAGGATAWLQSRNFAHAAALDRMQEESQWYQRRTTQLRERIERFEFESRLEQTPDVEPRDSRGSQ